MTAALMSPILRDDVPTAEELVGRARALIPMLRERAADTERNRMVSPETVRAYIDAGFFKILQPRRWGGWEMHPEVFWRVLMELGRGCGSSAWVMMILGVHQWEFGHVDPRAGDDVWAKDNSVLVGSSYAPWGNCEKVEGGYVLDGTWRTSSGCDHAQWTFLGALGRDADGTPVDRIALLVPRSDYEIVDDWHVFGLSGTGSKSLVLNKVFVPDYRVHSTQAYEIDDRGDMYMFPFSHIFCGSVSSVICGFAQGAIDLFTEQMKVRKNVGGIVSTQTSPYVKDRLGNAVVRVRSARARLFQVMAEITPYALKRELVPVEMRMEQMLDIARVGRDCEEAAMLLYKATAARGAYLSNPLQRVVRDILVASNHITQNADDTAGLLGGFMLGAELPPSSYGVVRRAAA